MGLCNLLEDLVYRAWDESLRFKLEREGGIGLRAHAEERGPVRLSALFPVGPKHGVCFSRAGLPVGEDGAIDAVEHALHGILRELVHLGLGGLSIEHRVVAALDEVCVIGDFDGSLVFAAEHGLLLDELRGKRRAHAHGDLYFLVFAVRRDFAFL